MPLVAILFAVLLTASPANPAPKAVCYTGADIAKVFNYSDDDVIYLYTKRMPDGSEQKYAQFYDVKSELFFFFPIDAKGCLHPENVVVVTQYDYLTFTGIPYI